jgi:hypothetical protein
MMSPTTVIPLRRPEEAGDPLMAILRSGARRLAKVAAAKLLSTPGQ